MRWKVRYTSSKTRHWLILYALIKKRRCMFCFVFSDRFTFFFRRKYFWEAFSQLKHLGFSPMYRSNFLFQIPLRAPLGASLAKQIAIFFYILCMHACVRACVRACVYIYIPRLGLLHRYHWHAYYFLHQPSFVLLLYHLCTSTNIAISNWLYFLEVITYIFPSRRLLWWFLLHLFL